MNDAQLLIGSLSNDLFRVSILTQRGSIEATTRFLQEAKRWVGPLQLIPIADYIKDIARDIEVTKVGPVSQVQAERFLMYDVLLQNNALHHQ